MSESQRSTQLTREAVLDLLSNDEVAKVSTAETAGELSEGAEYLDLENLHQGVLRARAGTKVAMGGVLAKTAVLPQTWSKILARLGVAN